MYGAWLEYNPDHVARQQQPAATRVSGLRLVAPGLTDAIWGWG